MTSGATTVVTPPCTRSATGWAFHTFEGGCSAGNDRVDDTAAEAQPSLTCEVGRDTCDADGLDPVRNFMNYSFDSCMNMFTPGQVSRMTDNWLAYRTP